MSRKSRKKKAEASAPIEQRYKPKVGPGSVFVEEFVSAKTGCERRSRNIAEHPLTLAHARGKISDDQFAAGEEVRLLCELRGCSGKDSTTLMTGGTAGPRDPFTQSQIDAIRRLDHIRRQLKERDWIIVEKFCGEGWSMAASVRAATLCHPSSVHYRVQEALEELVAARKGRRVHPFRGDAA
jgi:hypothetical protein